MNRDLQDLHDLLDRPLPGEPAPRPAASVVSGARRSLARRRLATGGAVTGAAVVAGVVALGLTGGASTATDPVPAATQPVASPAAWPPTDDAVRERYPEAAAMADCLSTQGFPVELGADGGVGFEGGTAVMDRYDVAVAGCRVEDDRELADLTNVEWLSLYGQESDTAACLREQGFEIPAIPTPDRFRARYPTERAWTAYSFVPVTGENAWTRLTWECPQPSLP